VVSAPTDNGEILLAAVHKSPDRTWINEKAIELLSLKHTGDLMIYITMD
jgi:hypothetical protein